MYNITHGMSSGINGYHQFLENRRRQAIASATAEARMQHQENQRQAAVMDQVIRGAGEQVGKALGNFRKTHSAKQKQTMKQLEHEMSEVQSSQRLTPDEKRMQMGQYERRLQEIMESPASWTMQPKTFKDKQDEYMTQLPDGRIIHARNVNIVDPPGGDTSGQDMQLKSQEAQQKMRIRQAEAMQKAKQRLMEDVMGEQEEVPDMNAAQQMSMQTGASVEMLQASGRIPTIKQNKYPDQNAAMGEVERRWQMLAPMFESQDMEQLVAPPQQQQQQQPQQAPSMAKNAAMGPDVQGPTMPPPEVMHQMMMQQQNNQGGGATPPPGPAANNPAPPPQDAEKQAQVQALLQGWQQMREANLPTSVGGPDEAGLPPSRSKVTEQLRKQANQGANLRKQHMQNAVVGAVDYFEKKYGPGWSAQVEQMEDNDKYIAMETLKKLRATAE